MHQVKDCCINKTAYLFSALLRMSNPATSRSRTQCQNVFSDSPDVFRRSPLRRKVRQSVRQALADLSIYPAIDVSHAWVPVGLSEDLGNQPIPTFRLATRAKPLQPSANGIKIPRDHRLREDFLIQPCVHVSLADGLNDRFLIFEIAIHLPDRDARHGRDLCDARLVKSLLDEQRPSHFEKMASTRTGPFAQWSGGLRRMHRISPFSSC